MDRRNVPKRRASGRSTAASIRRYQADRQRNEKEAAKRWPVLLALGVSAVGTAIVTIIGLGPFQRWALFLVSADLSAVVTLLTLAVSESRQRVPALWISNVLLIVLLSGMGIYCLAASPDQPINVVVVRNVTLSNEAGTAPGQEPSGLSFLVGEDETANCYSVVTGTVWLYFYQDSQDFGWGPVTDFRYENGFPDHLPPHC
jgi:hypothetical protein